MSRPKSTRNKAYLSKRALQRATGKATRKISSQAMNLKGYIIQAENGWVVKIDKTGKREQLSRINGVNHHRQVALD